MRELNKFNLNINVIPNDLEKYMSFSINELSYVMLYFVMLCILS